MWVNLSLRFICLTLTLCPADTEPYRMRQWPGLSCFRWGLQPCGWPGWLSPLTDDTQSCHRSPLTSALYGKHRSESPETERLVHLISSQQTPDQWRHLIGPLCPLLDNGLRQTPGMGHTWWWDFAHGNRRDDEQVNIAAKWQEEMLPLSEWCNDAWSNAAKQAKLSLKGVA